MAIIAVVVVALTILWLVSSGGTWRVVENKPDRDFDTGVAASSEPTADDHASTDAGSYDPTRRPETETDDKPGTDRSSPRAQSDEGGKQEDGGKIVVQLVDIESEPVPGLRVRYAQSKAAAAMMSETSRADVDPVWLDSHALTDADGRIEIDDVPRSSGMVFYLDDDDWLVSRIPDADSFFVMPSNGWSLRPTVRQQTVTLQKPGTIILDIKYADGMPARGTIGYSVWMKETEAADRETGYPREPIEVYGALVEIRKLPPVGRLWGNFASKRKGFASKTVFDFRIEDGHRHEIVIPRDDVPRWGLEIDLGALADDESVHVAVINQDGIRTWEHMQTGPAVVRTDALNGMTDEATVMVFGKRCWRSRVINLADSPGEWQRVSAVLEAPATVSMRIVDETGAPVHPAVALYDNRCYVDWTQDYSEARVSSGMWARHFACADEDGKISYTGLPPGSYDFVVEAPGYLQESVSVSLTPGREVDARRVVLRKMSIDKVGTIVVKLQDVPDPEMYVVQLGTPILNRPIRDPVDFDENGVAKLEMLNLRDYGIAVRLNPVKIYGREEEFPNNHWWTARVSLSEDKKQAIITIGPDTPHQVPADD